jgi:hypothetical protein
LECPNLARVVETHVQTPTGDVTEYLVRLRTQVVPAIRALQSDGRIRWYSFLLHPAKQLLGRPETDEAWVIHLRLEPATGLEVEEFIVGLPAIFETPVLRPLADFDGPDPSLIVQADWAHAWRIVGESSEWVACMLEAHPGNLSVEQIAHFLHYISNPLGLGWQWAFAPTGTRF